MRGILWDENTKRTKENGAERSPQRRDGVLVVGDDDGDTFDTVQAPRSRCGGGGSAAARRMMENDGGKGPGPPRDMHSDGGHWRGREIVSRTSARTQEKLGRGGFNGFHPSRLATRGPCGKLIRTEYGVIRVISHHSSFSSPST